MIGLDSCEHIQPCTECSKSLCSYCIEDCDGCPIEACEECFNKHLVKCESCETLLCPKNLKGVQCPSCNMQDA